MFPLKDNLRCNNFATISTWLIVANLLAFFAEVGMIVSGRQQEFFSTWLMVPHNFFTDIASGDPSGPATNASAALARWAGSRA